MKWWAAAVVTCACVLAQAQPAPTRSPAATAWLWSVNHATRVTWHPLQVFDDHLQGRDQGPFITELRVTIAASGELRDVVVVKSSGLPELDDAALAAFRAVPRFDPPPPELVDPATGAATFPFGMMNPGWRPPVYLGDTTERTPVTSSWELGSSVEIDRRTASTDASYMRTTLDAEAAYRLGGWGLLDVRVPFSTIRFHDPSNTALEQLTGFGDTELHFHRYGRFWRRWFSGWYAGLSIPTGKTEAMPVVGAATPTVVQLGSGAFEPEFGACTHVLFLFGTNASIGTCDDIRVPVYTNGHDYKDTGEFEFRLFVADTFLDRQLSDHLGLYFLASGSATLAGQPLPDTGGFTLFAEDSVWVLVYQGLAARATIEWPLTSHLNGVQLTEQVRAMIGLSWDFDRR